MFFNPLFLLAVAPGFTWWALAFKNVGIKDLTPSKGELHVHRRRRQGA
jgi:hypothetical protein